jgi:hypothetical protein
MKNLEAELNRVIDLNNIDEAEELKLIHLVLTLILSLLVYVLRNGFLPQ